MTFAKSSAAERKRLEADVDTLIRDSFKSYDTKDTYSFLSLERRYEIYEDDLLTVVKGIIAQVKLKEKNGTEQG